LNPLKEQFTNHSLIDIIIENSFRFSIVLPAPFIFYDTKIADWLTLRFSHGSSKLCVHMYEIPNWLIFIYTILRFTECR